VELEPTIPGGKQLQTDALDCTATGFSTLYRSTTFCTDAVYVKECTMRSFSRSTEFHKYIGCARLGSPYIAEISSYFSAIIFVFFFFCFFCHAFWTLISLLKSTSYVMHHQFNIQQLYALPTLYSCILYLFEKKQQLVPLTA